MSDKSGGRYNANKQMKFQISMLWSDLYDFSNSYNVVKGTITVYAKRRENRNIDTCNRKLVFKICAACQKSATL